MIALDYTPPANQDLRNHQIAFNPATPNNISSPPTSNFANPPSKNDGSMFDLLDPNINQENNNNG